MNMTSGKNDFLSEEDETTSDETSAAETPEQAALRKKEEFARQMSTVVCICKGINLGRVLKGMDGCETVADVNRKVGTGSGGCAGERCGPRIKILLRKKKESKKKRAQEKDSKE